MYELGARSHLLYAAVPLLAVFFIIGSYLLIKQHPTGTFTLLIILEIVLKSLRLHPYPQVCEYAIIVTRFPMNVVTLLLTRLPFDYMGIPSTLGEDSLLIHQELFGVGMTESLIFLLVTVRGNLLLLPSHQLRLDNP